MQRKRTQRSEKIKAMTVSLVLAFLSGLKGLQEKQKKSKAICVPVVRGRQKTDDNIEKAEEIIRRSRGLCIRAVAEFTNIDKEVRQILHEDFNMNKMC